MRFIRTRISGCSIPALLVERRNMKKKMPKIVGSYGEHSWSSYQMQSFSGMRGRKTVGDRGGGGGSFSGNGGWPEAVMAQISRSNIATTLAMAPKGQRIACHCMEESRGQSWSTMEADCLSEIFARLGLDDLTLVIPFVCKSWLAAVRHPLCWKKLDFRRVDVLPWSNFSKAFASLHYLPFFSFLHLLRLAVHNGCGSTADLRLPLSFTSSEDLQFISDQCPKLQSLALPVLCREDEALLTKLVCRWRHLERLELKATPSNLPELLEKISLRCRSFAELIVSGEMGEAEAAAIGRFAPTVRKLDLSGSYMSKKELLVILRGCGRLQELKANGCAGFVADDAEIRAAASGIRVFETQGCRLSRGEGDDCSNESCFKGYVFNQCSDRRH